MSPSAPESPLDEDLVALVADRRARNNSWEAIAQEITWDVNELRRAIRHEPDFDRMLERAIREVQQEADAEGMQRLRLLVRDGKPHIALEAAGVIMQYLAGERRDRTRLEVEKLRAETALARLDAKRVKPTTEPEEPPVNLEELPPEEVHTPNLESRKARRAADGLAVVWLWGGQHKLGDTEPDPGSDVPLVLVGDDTLPGRSGDTYWAMRFPLEGNPLAQPFRTVAVEPLMELSDEQKKQFRDFGLLAKADTAATAA